MGKNIVIFSDGTCNESDKGYPTNVLKLYKAVERRTVRQVAFYDPGVGTDFFKITGAAFGVGISANIRQCYEFLIDFYSPGDKVYLFGFSRGAFTVRSLAGMIHKTGILKRIHRGRTNQAFKIYKKSNNQEEADRFFRRYCWQEDVNGKPPAIYFIGVWDTVSALGIPFAAVKSLNPFSARWYGFHDAQLHQEVKYGYQALSIDDQRKVFKPEIWDESDIPKDQTLEQVWFAGVHSNIGGGYRRTGLSDITLEWMMKRSMEAGLLFWDDYTRRVLMLPNYNGKLYDSRSGFGKIYIKAIRKIPENAKIHQTVFLRKANRDNLYHPPNLPTSYTIVKD